MTAVLNPAFDRPYAALKPAPPAPTTKALNVIIESYITKTISNFLEKELCSLTFNLQCQQRIFIKFKKPFENFATIPTAKTREQVSILFNHITTIYDIIQIFGSFSSETAFLILGDQLNFLQQKRTRQHVALKKTDRNDFGKLSVIMLKMNLKYLIYLAFVVFWAVEFETAEILPCIQGNWIGCGISIGTIVFKLHKWSGSRINVCNHSCKAEIKGRVRKLKWVWDGRVNCDGLGSGQKRGKKSRNGAIEGALQDLFSKLSPEQLKKKREKNE
ncbi:hypothetical protein BpHYR1_014970 [Brachionus plicatilis]|uniref:Uncharacterized protein n=1 Tax=Brachionus plicatilis TaxID=10195 RepID=A0A3M7QU43_BRAPC|nr:hypothetical protein BpHYR1_014970 [Brachionus plicatilis]